VPGARLDHVGLNAADLDAMVAWYTAAFGYTVQHRFDLTDLDLRIVMLVDRRGQRFELLQRTVTTPGLRAATPVEAAGTSGYGHVCFVVDDLDETFAWLIELDASPVLSPGPAPEQGVRMAWVHDPERNLIELITPPDAESPGR
jgi:catechol 2,3-dioxygenase-like lactoylglutathione lyase family enzyme